MGDATNLKLSEASALCGVSVSVLQLLIADDLLPQVVRSGRGHAYLPSDQVPTWQVCCALLEMQRTRHLKRAKKALDRLAAELEAVGNDIAEALEYPREPLGIDLLSSASYSVYPHHERSTLAAALHHLNVERMAVERYHDALGELVEQDRNRRAT